MTATRILFEGKLPAAPRLARTRALACALLLVFAAACQSTETQTASAPGDATRTETSTTVQQSSQAARASEETLLTPQQVGRVRLGMTVGEVKRLFPGAALHTATLPDVPAVTALRRPDGKDILYFSTQGEGEGGGRQTPRDDERVTQIITGDRQFQTEEGVGPGSTLDEAVKAYGEVKLLYSPDAEYAKFSREPASRFTFWVAPPVGQKTAGVYRMTPDELSGGYYQSAKFNPGAKISYVAVSDAPAARAGENSSPGAPSGGSAEVAAPLRGVLAKIKGQAGVPVLLPSELPPTLAKQTIYADGSADKDGYEISLSSRPNCGANACFVGSLEAHRGEQPGFDRKVQLAQNITGYFQPTSCGGSCSPPIIEWASGGVLYHFQLEVQWRTKLTEADEERLMVEVANSAIKAGAR